MLNTVLSFTFMDLFNPRNKPVRLMGLLLTPSSEWSKLRHRGFEKLPK